MLKVVWLIRLDIYGIRLIGIKFIRFISNIYIKIVSVNGVISVFLLWKVFLMLLLINLIISLINVCILLGMLVVVFEVMFLKMIRKRRLRLIDYVSVLICYV